MTLCTWGHRKNITSTAAAVLELSLDEMRAVQKWVVVVEVENVRLLKMCTLINIKLCARGRLVVDGIVNITPLLLLAWLAG